MSVRVDITGHKQVDTLLSNLSDSLQRKVIISAFRKAAKPVLTRMRSLSPMGESTYQNYLGQLHIPGWLKKSHGIIPAKSKTHPGIWVGPKVGKKYAYDGFYFKFIIEGDLTAEHIKNPKKNWMTQAMRQTEPISVATIKKELGDAVERNAVSISKRARPGVLRMASR